MQDIALFLKVLLLVQVVEKKEQRKKCAPKKIK